MATPQSNVSGSDWGPEPVMAPTLTDAGGLDALQAKLELLSRQEDTPEPDIDPSSFPPQFRLRCRAMWCYFEDDWLDDARDTICLESYWRWDFATLFIHWIRREPTADQVPELASLWCSSSADRSWRAIAVSLRNKLLETGMSRAEIHQARLSCEHEEYFETELNHLKPIQEKMERDYRLRLAQEVPDEPNFETVLLEVFGVQAPTMPVIASTQPTQRKRRQPKQQQGQDIVRSTVTTRSQAKLQQRATRSQSGKQDNSGRIITRAQARKREGHAGKEPNVLRERVSNSRNIDPIPIKRTRGKATRKNDVDNMGVVEGKVASKTRRRTVGTRKQVVK